MKKFLLFILSLVTFCTFIGCRSARPTAQLVREVHTDTLYLSNVQYDSIFVFNDRQLDRSRDTLLIRETNTEYRYKLLRDTIERIKLVVHHDSIPYEVRTTITKEVRKPPNLFDYLCYLSFGILLGIVGWKVIKIIPSRH